MSSISQNLQAAHARIAEAAGSVSRDPRSSGLLAQTVQNFEQQRTPYRQLSEFFEQLRSQGLALDTLPMGMSAPIAEVATTVRLGTAIFGNRNNEK